MSDFTKVLRDRDDYAEFDEQSGEFDEITRDKVYCNVLRKYGQYAENFKFDKDFVEELVSGLICLLDDFLCLLNDEDKEKFFRKFELIKEKEKVEKTASKTGLEEMIQDLLRSVIRGLEKKHSFHLPEEVKESVDFALSKVASQTTEEQMTRIWKRFTTD